MGVACPLAPWRSTPGGCRNAVRRRAPTTCITCRASQALAARLCSPRLPGEGEGQADVEAGVPRLGRDVDGAVVLLDDRLVDNVQAEARADALRLGGEERLEDARLNVRRDARPGVADLDHDPIRV